MENKELNLAQAMLEVQKELPKIAKNAKGYGYNYADLPSILNVVMPILHKYSIRLKWNNSINNESNILSVQPVFERVATDGSIETEKGFAMSRPLANNTKNDLQADGSALTYLERYTLCASLAIELGDDDGASFERVANNKPSNNNNAKIQALNNKINYYANRHNTQVKQVLNNILNKYNVANLHNLTDAQIAEVTVMLES